MSWTNYSFFTAFFSPPQDEKIHIYSIQGNTLKDEGQTIDSKGRITDMAYSNDGAYLAVLKDNKVVIVYSVADGYTVNIYLYYTFCLLSPHLITNCFVFFPSYQVKNEHYGHHAKPVSLAWSPDNEHFATGGMDMMVFIWTVSDADKRIKLPGRRNRDRTESIQCKFEF